MRAYADTQIHLTIPASREHVLVIRTALGGVGLLMGLDMDRMDDLRTAADEACDYLMSQDRCAQRLQMDCRMVGRVMETEFTALFETKTQQVNQADQTVAKAILETLIPQVTFVEDGQGVCGIRLGLPVEES